MNIIRAGLRPALAFIVIAHGLAHAVLPLRGWMDPQRLALDFMPLILYSTAVIGFTVAGLGILGIRPFAAITRQALVLASAYSLVAISLMGDGDLWWGASVDVALLLCGFTGLYRRLPLVTNPLGGLLRSVTTAAAAAWLLYAATAVVLWPLHRAWGSEPAEHALALPGDRPGRSPSLEIQHAVTVDAPPEQVWQWLVQLGQDRAGFYSYDWLERAFGVDIRNVSTIRPEWQARQPGDRVHATQANYLGGVFGREPGWTVTAVDPGRAMVLQYWGAFVLEPTGDGKTRFIIRTNVGHEKTTAWAAAVDMVAFEMPHFIMERRMMLRIKKLAEAHG